MIYRGHEIKREVVEQTGHERYRIYEGSELVGSEETEELALDRVDRIMRSRRRES